jgi:hypothetical protein
VFAFLYYVIINDIGCDYIAKRLNEMNIPKRKPGKWYSGTVLGIIKK